MFLCIIGIALFGVNQSLTVGQSATITCMTNIAVTSIEWRDQSSDVLASTTHQTVLDYIISPVTDNLQGQQLMCVAVAGATTHTEAVVMLVEGKCSYIRTHRCRMYHRKG